LKDDKAWRRIGYPDPVFSAVDFKVRHEDSFGRPHFMSIQDEINKTALQILGEAPDGLRFGEL